MGIPLQRGAAVRDLPDLPRHDALTGLLNHREFHSAIDAQLKGELAPKFSVVLLDLDGFRTLNDRRGHAEGDALLRRVASTLTANCRQSDVRARTGGDEFGLVLPGLDVDEAEAVCLELARVVDALDEGIGMSYGLAAAPRHGKTREDLLLHADIALYAGKRFADGTEAHPAPGSRARAAKRAEERGVRAQLAAYAADIRTSYARELKRSQELHESYIATVQTLATAVEAKDDNTGGHIHRVHDVGLLLASAIAPDEVADPQMAYGFLLHDIGKLSVPDAILTKPGKLDEEEWREIRRHPEEGVRILSTVPFLDRALDVVRHHHERWDGGGYPHGLRGEEIPRWARIFSVVDTADAIMSDRPYRRGRPFEVAVEIILEEAGRQFDPSVAQAFAALEPAELRRVWAQHAQAPGEPLLA